MECDTVNYLRRLIFLFLLCHLFSCLIYYISIYPFWVNVVLGIVIISPIYFKVLPRLDVKEV